MENVQDSPLLPASEGVTASNKPPVHNALTTGSVPVNGHCVGHRWTIDEIDHLARIVAIVAMGQAAHAVHIIRELQPASPALKHSALFRAARELLRISGDTPEKRDSSRWSRDGFIFEVISWIAARQSSGPRAYLKDPHLRATTQGLDGLMVELHPEKPEVSATTIFEDKCSDHPRRKFKQEVLPTFVVHHSNARAPELVAIAASLIEKSGLTNSEAIKAAGRVLDMTCRHYRAALTISVDDDNQEGRSALFKDYEELGGIEVAQRIAATFVVNGDLRDSFDHLAALAIAAINEFEIK